jgi:hypothetical protein
MKVEGVFFWPIENENTMTDSANTPRPQAAQRLSGSHYQAA